MPYSVPFLFFWNGVLVEEHANLHISIDIYSPHEEGHVHSHNTLNPLSSNVSGIFHTQTIEEVYYPSHLLQQLEAAMKTIIQNRSRKNEEEIIKDHQRKHTCLTNLYINLSNVNNTYD